LGVIRDLRFVIAMTTPSQMGSDTQRTDADIAGDAALALRRHDEIPEQVQVVVDHGCVTLTGTVEWYLQRQRAEDVVQQVCGVRDVVNAINVAPHLPPPPEPVGGEDAG
jgi:osmotically-inducible protein OsmY